MWMNIQDGFHCIVCNVNMMKLYYNREVFTVCGQCEETTDDSLLDLTEMAEDSLLLESIQFSDQFHRSQKSDS